ncbi:MAG: IS1 family transposase [bacterium]
MNRLKPERQSLVLDLLAEGNSIRSIVRITGVCKNTIVRLMRETAQNCGEVLNAEMRNLHLESIECDEIWTYVGKKQKKLKEGDKEKGFGDQYVFVALDRKTKLVPQYLVGKRNGFNAWVFMQNLRRRVSNTPQITTDQFAAYQEAVLSAFGVGVHYAMLRKVYHGDGSGREGYSPAALKGVRIKIRIGRPSRDKISTSFVERQNLTMRMQMRRFARLTNAFSKTLENLEAALALHFYHYNFIRVHRSLGMTPAMAAKITDTKWSWKDVLPSK